MYDNILIPTDGSTVAENAVDHALELADRFGASVHALYVVDTDAMDLSLGTEQVERIKSGKYRDMPELQAEANSATKMVAEKAADRGIDCTEAVAAGRPHREIASYASENGIDLIVIGSHGRSGVKRVLLGSVTERVLRMTDIPVLVVDMQKDE